MKLVELIEQKLFVRDNNGVGYNIVVEGDLEISCYESEDAIHVFHAGLPVDIINLPVACAESGVCCKAYVTPDIEAAIVIMKSHN